MAIIVPVLLVAAVVVSFTATAFATFTREPEFWAFVEVVRHEPNVFGFVQENKVVAPIELHERKAIKEVVDFTKYSDYEILECNWDTCNNASFNQDHIVEHRERLKVIVKD